MTVIYKPHPVADIFPLISGNEFVELKQDIAENGLHESIVMYDGMILDGRNRFRACQEVGVTPHFVEYAGDDPVSYVISLNLRRRHLNESQRAMVAAKIANLPPHRPAGNTANLRTSQGEAAETLNVSERTVNTAKKVQREGAPKLIEAVESGCVSVSAAADLTALPKEVQTDIVAKGEDEIVKEANRIRREKKRKRQEERQRKKQEIPDDLPKQSDLYRLITSPCSRLVDCIEANSVDWIITDPPYPKEHLEAFSDLAAFADHALKQGGSLIVMSGQSYLPEVIKRLSSAGLDYYWTLAYLTPGGQSANIWTRRVNTFWKPLLWFVKGEYSGDKIGDVRKSPPNDNDKELHHWGQSFGGMKDIVEAFTYPGQVIADPFCGAGTTGVAAVSCNRIFIGSDISEVEVNTSAQRIQEFLRNAAT